MPDPMENSLFAVRITEAMAQAYGRRAASEGLPRDANPFDDIKERANSVAWLSGYDDNDIDP